MRLHFRVDGQGSPVIVLHGLLGSLDNWRLFSRRLARDFKVFSLDLRNHGQSPHSEIMNYRIMAQDLREFTEDRGLASAIVLGHSMGGKVAMQFAGDNPHVVDKLIVVDIAPKAYPPTHRCLLAALWALDLTGLKSFTAVDSAIAPLIADPAVRRFVLKSLIRDPHAGFRWKIGLDAILQNYDELTRPVVLEQPFRNPVCFIRGARSNHIEDNDLSLIRKMFSQVELIDIPDAGHWVHAEAPEEFFLAVVKFLHGRS